MVCTALPLPSSSRSTRGTDERGPACRNPAASCWQRPGTPTRGAGRGEVPRGSAVPLCPLFASAPPGQCRRPLDGPLFRRQRLSLGQWLLSLPCPCWWVHPW